jgi:hypothetical protein
VDERIAVIYTSKFGSTQTYAEWISWAVGAHLFPARGRREDLLEYDTIVYGGYRRGDEIEGLDYIRKNFDALHGRRLVIFVVGIAPVRPAKLNSMLARVFTPAERKYISIFGLRGAFNAEKLRGKDRFQIGRMKARLKRQALATLDPDEQALLDACDRAADCTDEKTIEPIVQAIQKGGRPIDVFAAREQDGAGAEKTPPPARRSARRTEVIGEEESEEVSDADRTNRLVPKTPPEKRRPRKAPAKKRAARKMKPALKKRIVRKKKSTLKRPIKKKKARRAAPKKSCIQEAQPEEADYPAGQAARQKAPRPENRRCQTEGEKEIHRERQTPRREARAQEENRPPGETTPEEAYQEEKQYPPEKNRTEKTTSPQIVGHQAPRKKKERRQDQAAARKRQS